MQSESSEHTSTTWRFTAGLMAVGITLEWVVPGVAPRWADGYAVSAGRLAELLGVFVAAERGLSDVWNNWTSGRARRRERRLYREALRNSH